MAARYFGLIPAAGTGSRFGGELPKQYQPLHGRALVSHAIDSLADETPITRVYVVHAQDDRRIAQVTGGSGRVVALACGGATRAESVKNGLAALRGELRDDDWMLVHDAARPCLPKDALRRLLHEVADDPVGGLLAIPVADTLKRAGPDTRVSETEPRDGLWQAQTPQMFRFHILRAAFAQADIEHITDEAQAVEGLGLRPRIVPGSRTNFKITFPEDLGLVAAVLAVERETLRQSA